MSGVDSRIGILQETVRVKRLRSKNATSSLPILSQEDLRRKVNFKNFQLVYNEQSRHSKSNHSPTRMPTSKSGTLFNIRYSPEYIETINIELPWNYGADRAVQLIENKIKPKKSIKQPLNVVDKVPIKKEYKVKPTKSVTFMDQPQTIDEYLFPHLQKSTETTRKHIKDRRLPLPKNIKIVKKKNDNQIMNALTNINEKLHKLEKQYFDAPKIQFKNVNDCCTQMENLEILYENDQYPTTEVLKNNTMNNDLKKLSHAVLSDIRMQERIREMNERFPEFPKLEDTLRDIEQNLENIVEMNGNPDSQRETVGSCEGDNLVIEKPHKLDDEDCSEKLYNLEPKNEGSRISDYIETDVPVRDGDAASYHEGSELEKSITKSSYLTREFSNMEPTVKIFSENHKLSFWRNKMRDVKRHSEGHSVESVTKILDTLKFTLENSIYDPVM